MSLNQIETVLPGIIAVISGAAVDHNRQLLRVGHLHLSDKDALLHFAWRMIVIVIEADLAPGNHFRIASKLIKFGEIRFLRHLRFMRMDSDRCVNNLMLFSDLDGAVERARAITGAHSEHVHDASLTRTSNHLLAIRVETGAIEVAMGINEHGCSPCGSDTLVRPA